MDTDQKLIKRTIFQDHVNILNKRQEDLLVELKSRTEEGFLKAREEWEKAVVQWRTSPPLPSLSARIHTLTSSAETRQDKAKEAEAEAKAGTGTGDDSASGPSGSAPPPAARQSTEDAGSGTELDHPPAAAAAAATKEKAEPHPPSKKFRMTEGMKGIVWSLVSLSNECCRLENEKK